MYESGTKWNVLTDWMPAASRYSKRRSKGDVIIDAGAVLTEYSALFSVASSCASDVVSVNGRGCVVSWPSTSSCGLWS